MFVAVGVAAGLGLMSAAAEDVLLVSLGGGGHASGGQIQIIARIGGIVGYARANNGTTEIQSNAVVAPASTNPPLGIDGVHLVTGEIVELTVNVANGATLVVQASDDLAAWDELAQVIVSQGRVLFTDSFRPSRRHRFYRLVL